MEKQSCRKREEGCLERRDEERERERVDGKKARERHVERHRGERSVTNCLKRAESSSRGTTGRKKHKMSLQATHPLLHFTCSRLPALTASY